MKKYSKYKKTDIDWIGEIPEGWDALKIRRLTSVSRGASPRPIADQKYFDENGEFSWVRIADVTASERYLKETTQTLSELGASLSVKMYPNDFFLSIAGSVGKPIITKIKCCIHDGFVYFPESNVDPEFLYYIFSSKQPYKGLGKQGTQLNLNTDTVADIPIPLPSQEEIDTIVTYLDHKTALIDKLIASNEKQIKLLEEKRKATINQAVTKGLDPNVKMKDSGVEWVGEIPEHWEVKKLKWVVSKVGSGVTPKGGAKVYQENGIPLLRSQNIQNDRLNLEDVAYISEEIFESMSNSQVYDGDVLLNITGASIGRVFYYDRGILANVNQHVCIIRPIKQDLAYKYLYFLLVSKIGQTLIELNTTGSGREGLNFEAINNFQLFLPTIKEQKSIITKLEKVNLETKQIIEKLRAQNKLLKEYRQSLISHVVTGKVDVRDEVKMLGNEHD